jgi:predicted glycosyl hydrolase (DUF1957 family)
MERLNEKLDAHVEYTKQLDKAEKGRIDAIREMDSKAIEVATSQARESASILAKQLTTSIAGLREYVESVQSTLLTSRATLTDLLSSRIAVLEENQYKTQGKSEVSKTVIAILAVVLGSIVTISFQHFVIK